MQKSYSLKHFEERYIATNVLYISFFIFKFPAAANKTLYPTLLSTMTPYKYWLLSHLIKYDAIAVNSLYFRD